MRIAKEDVDIKMKIPGAVIRQRAHPSRVRFR